MKAQENFIYNFFMLMFEKFADLVYLNFKESSKMHQNWYKTKSKLEHLTMLWKWK